MRYLTIALSCMLITPCTVTSAQNGNALQATIWTVDFTETLNKMSAPEKARYDSMSLRAKESMQKSFHGRSFHFKDSDAVTISFTINDQAREVNGSWYFNAAQSELVITVTGTSHAYRVEWEGDGSMLLKYKDAPSGAAISSLCLIRN
jgi:uncharacterized lipoprotein YehR (DUF1307 family)